MTTATDTGIRVLITGGAGFLGALLTRRLLDVGPAGVGGLRVGGRDSEPVQSVTILDLVPPADDIAWDPRVKVVQGEVADVLGQLPVVDLVFHLAGVVSGAAEADFDLGMHTNVDGTRALLEFSRSLAVPPVFVFASTLAAFGSDPAIGPIGVVDDDTLPRPQSSYGTQKVIGEYLVADYSRKGFVRGRTVRLMTVTVRPGKPNAAASSFLSGIIREPLAGLPADCPVPPDTPIALSSPDRTLEGILRAAELDDAAWGSRSAMNLPALTTTPREMALALDRVTGTATSELITWTNDPAVAAIVETWASRLTTDRATALGLRADESFEAVVRGYVDSQVIDTGSLESEKAVRS